jgi:hypothetical protein
VVGYVSPAGSTTQCLIHPSPDGHGYVLGERTYPTLEDIICVNSAVLNKPLLASQFCAVVPEMGFAPAVASNAVKDHYAMDAWHPPCCLRRLWDQRWPRQDPGWSMVRFPMVGE